MTHRIRPTGITVLVLLSLLWPLAAAAETSAPGRSVAAAADGLRPQPTRLIEHARDCARAAATETAAAPELAVAGDWQVSVDLYRDGASIAAGEAEGAMLDEVVCAAVAEALPDRSPAASAADARFLIRVRRDDADLIAVIEHNGEGHELVGDLVAVERITRDDVRQAIEASKQYLLRIKHPELHGFSKKFDLARGGFDDRLRTIYTSSSLYTLLRLNGFEPDPEVQRQIEPIAGFILAMQRPEAPYAGAFHYAYDLTTGEKERRFPVGTNAKIIMTLVALYDVTKDASYLHAAEAAGDWLLSVQEGNGAFPVDIAWRDDAWQPNPAFSLFYNCQVLTGLSRLYGASGEQRYLDGAAKLASLLLRMVDEGGHLLRDEYRPKVASISTSWLAMALLDFYRIQPDAHIADTVFACMDQVLTLQLTDADDLSAYGRFADTSATSGNGWINEVTSEVYAACLELRPGNCDQYRRSLIMTTRWLIQNSYSAANTYQIPDPERVIGGLIRNAREQAVRTDAVCHGVNSMVGLLSLTDDDLLAPAPAPAEAVNAERLPDPRP